MTDHLFAELESDRDAIAVFDAEQISLTESSLFDEEFNLDVEKLVGIFEDPNEIGRVTRRGKWLYDFKFGPTHPRGLWRRIPMDSMPTPDADWFPVFDLDAFCTETGEDWHWNGAATLWSNPDRVVIALSYRGSDQTRHIEWDCNTTKKVPGGFDLAPARSSVDWFDSDTLLVSTADLPGAATRSGWQGRCVRLGRGMALADAPVIFEVDHGDLLGDAYSFPLTDGGRGIGYRRLRTIGDAVQSIEVNGQISKLSAPRNTICMHSDQHYAYIASDEGFDPAGSLVLLTVDGTSKRVVSEAAPRRAIEADSIIFSQHHLLWIVVDNMDRSLMRLDLRRDDAVPEILPLPAAAENFRIWPHDANSDRRGPLQLTLTGFLNPSQTWVFDPDAPKPTFEFLRSSPSTFDASGKRVHLHMATSDDGTEVPYHIVLPENAAPGLPVIQYGYGGYGVALSPFYLGLEGPMWLERGGAFVLSYIRGGSEFGKAWHLAAKKEHRHRAFADFAAIASDLVARGYTTADKIACHGSSNGGLLCGVMLTRYPEKFGAVWASVGVYDMLRYHLFPAGAGWIDEYGDPDDESARAWLLDYSPIHQVVQHAERSYPPALIETNDSDDRVDPSHSRRFAARLLDAGQPALFYSRSGGHGVGGQTKEIASEMALGYAFLRHKMM